MEGIIPRAIDNLFLVLLYAIDFVKLLVSLAEEIFSLFLVPFELSSLLLRCSTLIVLKFFFSVSNK